MPNSSFHAPRPTLGRVRLCTTPTLRHTHYLNTILAIRGFESIQTHVESAVHIYLKTLQKWDEGLECYLWHPKSRDIWAHPNKPTKGIMQINDQNSLSLWFPSKVNQELLNAGHSSLGLRTPEEALASAWEFYLYVGGMLANQWQLRNDCHPQVKSCGRQNHEIILAF